MRTDPTRPADFTAKQIRALDIPKPGEVEDFHLASMADAMNLAMQTSRNVIDDDPDPYGYGQELEEEFGVDILAPQWKAKPDDARWVKRLKGRARKTAVVRLAILGHKPEAIAQKVKVSLPTVYSDLRVAAREWRRTYLDDIEELAHKDLAALDYMQSMLEPGIARGDTKSILAAVDIIKEKGNILGYRQGMQIDLEQYVREVAESNGFDPQKAVEIAQRISITMRNA